MPYTLEVHRRQFLEHAITWGGIAFFGSARTHAAAFAQGTCGAPDGTFLGTIPVHGTTARATPFGQIVGGSGLDGRKFTDISSLQPDRLITPTRDVFVRTTAPPDALSAVRDRGLDADALLRAARPMGAHLIECAGNTDPDNFGLMSVADWRGVPLSDYLASHHQTAAAAPAILVSGVDHASSSRTSAAGASWVFSADAIRSTGAFLATHLNGEPLPLDHGAPVRLVVPGWYGCSWIKWVHAIAPVAEEEPPTPQMIEFSLRTHQRAVPRRALDYEPPVIDVAATPVRIEKYRVDGKLRYRVVGIVWGGHRPVDRLMIRFRAGEAPTAFTICPAPRTHRTWSLWDYWWTPPAPGVYSIALTAADPAIRTRRLDVSFYVRRVIVDEA
jgi:DMSO/TMAO reductase YedYZ molybdopterin-dependent catalytic subunit